MGSSGDISPPSDTTAFEPQGAASDRHVLAVHRGVSIGFVLRRVLGVPQPYEHLLTPDRRQRLLAGQAVALNGGRYAIAQGGQRRCELHDMLVLVLVPQFAPFQVIAVPATRREAVIEEQRIMRDDPEPTERDKLLEETHKRSMELVKRIEGMMLAVVKTQVTVEIFMTELLEAHARDPQRFFFTGQKIKECKEKIDPPEVGQSIWELLSLCSYVRNELVHSLNTEKIKEASDNVREAYIAVTPHEDRKQEIRDASDTDVVTKALRHCGGFIVVATGAKIAANKKG